MNPKTVKISAALALALFVIITAGLLYNFNKNKLTTTTPTKTTTGESNLSAQDQSDQEEGKRVMKSFTLTYNSYRMGDTSNITSLYPVMCAGLATAERTKAEALQKKFTDYHEYITVESQDTQTVMESYDENKIIVEVSIEKITWNGALAPDDSDKFNLLDRNGQKYSGTKNDLIDKTVTEVYRVTGVKESSDWKVCEFQKIK